MQVYFWPWGEERQPVKEFIGTLERKTQEGFMDEFSRFEKYGIDLYLQTDKLKPITGKPYTKLNLFEFRFRIKKVAYRVFACIKNDECWLIHAFIKKSYKTPRKELNIAESRCKIILNY